MYARWYHKMLLIIYCFNLINDQQTCNGGFSFMRTAFLAATGRSEMSSVTVVVVAATVDWKTGTDRERERERERNTYKRKEQEQQPNYFHRGRERERASSTVRDWETHDLNLDPGVEARAKMLFSFYSDAECILVWGLCKKEHYGRRALATNNNNAAQDTRRKCGQ